MLTAQWIFWIAVIVYAVYYTRNHETKKKASEGLSRLDKNNCPQVGLRYKILSKSVPKTVYGFPGENRPTARNVPSVIPAYYLLTELDGVLVWIPESNRFPVLEFSSVLWVSEGQKCPEGLEYRISPDGKTFKVR